MNPDTPKSPREELEARITALLLGELTAEEAASLLQTIAQDAELGRLQKQLQQTIELVRETATSPSQESVASTETLRLSSNRREKLLASFKITRPKEFKAKRSKAEKREWMAVAAMAIGLLVVAGLVVRYQTRDSRLGRFATS